MDIDKNKATIMTSCGEFIQVKRNKAFLQIGSLYTGQVYTSINFEKLIEETNINYTPIDTGLQKIFETSNEILKDEDNTPEITLTIKNSKINGTNDFSDK
jgi:hypothetical protein